MTPLIIMAALAMAAALIVRRKQAFNFRWQPTRHTWAALAAGLAAFLLSLLLLLLPHGSWPGRVVTFVFIWAGLGFALPWAWTLMVERAGPSAMGLTRERWKSSLVLNLALGAMMVGQTLSQADPSRIDPVLLGRGMFVLLTGNLFELFLYYGFIHLRLEKAFGIIPAILVTSAVYVLWHAGTQLPLEADPWQGALKLFFVGILYQSVFSLTRNLLAIWPFFVGAGVMHDFIVNVKAMDHMSVLVPWAALTVGLMAVCGLVLSRLNRRVRPG
ncbi:MAG: CPBP family intramembrane metalloprotease [Proteobacteria bacterium]|nr:CPBP family intramembrane metalloprotease [Pseudomonadota bacterium]